MTEPTQWLIASLVYRALVLFVGAFVIYLGYRLFRLGVVEAAGDIEAVWKDRKLLLKRAAPGTILMLVGCAIVVNSLVKGPSVTGPDYDIQPAEYPANPL